MKRSIALVLALVMLFSFVSCREEQEEEPIIPLRLFDFVGVWTDIDESQYYRFTPNGTWYHYNKSGEVVSNGNVQFDGEKFTLTDAEEKVTELFATDRKSIRDAAGTAFSPCDAPSSLISSSGYELYFNCWYEDANLNGNYLTIESPDVWHVYSPDNEVLYEGVFYAYADEDENLYLFTTDKDSIPEYFGIVCLCEGEIRLQREIAGILRTIPYALQENSTERTMYFKEKQITVNYALGSGNRLLRNGGAAFNDAHDYKKMPVNCRIDMKEDRLDSAGNRRCEIVVTYEFKETDMPDLSGGRIYNSVRFSQYDYYSGELFHLEDSTGNDDQFSQWTTQHDGESYVLECEFSSDWEYLKTDGVLVRWQGTYELTMPADYDGFVICLRPVFNSYSAQVSSSITPAEGTLLLEDLGDDVDDALFCRIDKYQAESEACHIPS